MGRHTSTMKNPCKEYRITYDLISYYISHLCLQLEDDRLVNMGCSFLSQGMMDILVVQLPIIAN